VGREKNVKHTIVGLAALFLVAPVAGATTLVQMNLADLSGRAGRIFRGTVVAVDAGTVKAGGGELPTVAYRIKVTDALKGEFAGAGDSKYVVVRMIDPAQGGERTGHVRRVSPFRDLPVLERGREYLLFTTAPSRIGLSTTVGLGQGAFRIVGEGARAAAVNAYGNAGLFNRMGAALGRSAQPAAGPVAYGDMAARVRALVGR